MVEAAALESEGEMQEQINVRDRRHRHRVGRGAAQPAL